MTTALLHFAAGTLASLAIFLLFTWLSGARSFSAPFSVVFIGIACASMALYLSPWATPAIVTLYFLASASEFLQERKAKKPDAPEEEP